MRSPALFSVVASLVGIVACTDTPSAPIGSQGACRYGQTTLAAIYVPTCMRSYGLLSKAVASSDSAYLDSVLVIRDSLARDTTSTAFWKSAELTRATQSVVDFYARGLFDDSARFNRMLDHIRVTQEYLSGTLFWNGPEAWPKTTPYLAWSLYPNTGIFFQPVNTVQSVASLFPRATVTTDSLLNMGEQLYRYALWRKSAALRFPVWEYEFTWSSGGVTVLAPWVSSQAQGYAIILFTENYRRTGDELWLSRAYEVLNSYRVLWDEGGVMLPDTSHGYWWEEFHPAVMIWNGAAQALLAVGELWRATNDSTVKRMFDRGVEAMKYYTPEFDTGYWTLYSRTQWYNTVAYHQSCIRIMDALYTVSGDTWFDSVATRWRTYVPPPGVT